MLHGKVIIRKVACCELHISPLIDKKGYLDDISIVAKGGGCKANLAAITGLIGAFIEWGEPEVAIDKLRGHVCGACTGARLKVPKETEPIGKSCSDTIAQTLEIWLKEYKIHHKEEK